MSKPMAFTFDSSNNTCQAYTVPFTTYTYTSGIFTTYHNRRRRRRRWRCHTKWKNCEFGCLLWNIEVPHNLIPYCMTSCPQRCFTSFSQRCWNNRKTILFTKFSKSDIYFIQTSMPGLLNSSRLGSSYVRWVTAQQPTRKVGARLRYDLRAQNRNLQYKVWNAEEGVARSLLTCTFWIPTVSLLPQQV
jgi:hypothetical protein